MSRQLELWVSIQELNEQGEYSAVELSPAKDVNTGGVFQLRQVSCVCVCLCVCVCVSVFSMSRLP